MEKLTSDEYAVLSEETRERIRLENLHAVLVGNMPRRRQIGTSAELQRSAETPKPRGHATASHAWAPARKAFPFIRSSSAPGADTVEPDAPQDGPAEFRTRRAPLFFRMSRDRPRSTDVARDAEPAEPGADQAPEAKSFRTRLARWIKR